MPEVKRHSSLKIRCTDSLIESIEVLTSKGSDFEGWSASDLIHELVAHSVKNKCRDSDKGNRLFNDLMRSVWKISRFKKKWMKD